MKMGNMAEHNYTDDQIYQADEETSPNLRFDKIVDKFWLRQVDVNTQS